MFSFIIFIHKTESQRQHPQNIGQPFRIPAIFIINSHEFHNSVKSKLKNAAGLFMVLNIYHTNKAFFKYSPLQATDIFYIKIAKER